MTGFIILFKLTLKLSFSPLELVFYFLGPWMLSVNMCFTCVLFRWMPSMNVSLLSGISYLVISYIVLFIHDCLCLWQRYSVGIMPLKNNFPASPLHTSQIDMHKWDDWILGRTWDSEIGSYPCKMSSSDLTSKWFKCCKNGVLWIFLRRKLLPLWLNSLFCPACYYGYNLMY